MKKLWIPIIVLLLLTSLDGYGQRWKLRRYEAEFYLSAVSFHGDIGLANQPLLNNINGIRPSVGFKPGFKITQNLTGVLDLAYVIYGGKDVEGSSHNRYYSFNSHAFQHTAKLEYYILGDGRTFMSGAIYNRRGMINSYKKLYIYVFGGGGGVLSKSTVKDLNNNGEEPLENEGYNNNWVYTPVFPLGAGIKFSLDPRWSIGVEIGYQFSLGDYIDGYSSQWSKYNDSYYLTSVKAIMHIRNNRRGVPVFRKLYR
jgi:hypothetical protein